MRHFIHEMTKQTPQPTFFNDVFTTYLRPSFGRTSVPKTTLFNDVCTTYFLYAWAVQGYSSTNAFIPIYSPLIFVCVSCPKLVLSQRFITVYWPLIFACVTRYAKRLTTPLSQRLHHLSSYANDTHDCPRLVLSQRFYNDLFTAYFCMHHLACKTTEYTPQPMFFNDFITTYIRMHTIPHACAHLSFVCVTLYSKWLSRPLNQRFLMVCIPLIFVCTRPRLVLKQCFLMTHSPLILVCTLYRSCVRTDCPRTCHS